MVKRERSQADRRKVKLELTEKGESITDNINEISHTLQGLVGVLGKERKNELSQDLVEIAGKLQRQGRLSTALTGQCNDSYSLIKIAKEPVEATGVDDINELPISYDIPWYEQKAVTVLLALLSLGIEGIRLGPTLPAFVSENVLETLVEKFNIKPIGSVN